MKRSLLFLTIFLLTLLSAKAQFTLGDVRYSILEPSVFIPLNRGWILLDGGASPESRRIYQTSLLRSLTGMDSLPDARGVFIRGMNESRSLDSGDVDGDGTVGRYQKDAVIKHTHNLNKADHSIAAMHGSDKAEGDDRFLPTPYPLHLEVLDTGRNLDGKETRPRNIALYVYIKVN